MAEAHAHDAHDHGSTRQYWIIGGVLAVVTILEVALTLVSEPWGIPRVIEVPALLILSVIKGALVVMYFMHLKGDAAVFKFVFIAPFLMAVSMLLIFLALFSTHVGIAG